MADASKRQGAEVLMVGPREAAAMLGLSERKLWGITSPRGDVPAVKIGRCVRYPVAGLREWIASQLEAGTVSE